MSEVGGGGHGAVTIVNALASDPRVMNRTLSVKEVIQTIGSSKRNEKLRQILQEMDKNSDGTIDVAELIHVLQGVERTRRERKYLLTAVVAMAVFGLILIGTIIGLTYAMLYALKDTQVKGSVMYTKHSDGSVADIIRTGSAEFGVANGALVDRLGTAADANSTAPVLRTAAFMGTPQALHSEIDVETLLELKYLMIKGTGRVELGLAVHGVARIPLDGSVHGTVVQVLTTAGTVTLDGTLVTFSSAIADIFTEAGFRVAGSRRALLGMYSVLGFFSAVKDLSAAGLPAGQPGPKLPSQDFVMKIKLYEPCLLPDQPDVDRCKYAPPQVPGYEGASPPPPSPIGVSPPMPPYDESTAGNQTPPTGASAAQPPAFMTPPPAATNETTARRLAYEASLAEVFAAIGEVPAPRRLRHRYVATAAPIPVAGGNGRDRILAGEPELVDLAGVEEYMGVRYMTHNKTTYSFGGAIRVMYDFALYPDFQKIDVTTANATTLYSWQQTVLPENSTNAVATYWCSNASTPFAGLAGFNTSSVVNYTYAGLDSVGDTLARRFELFVTQPSSAESNGVMRIDYWDTLRAYTPLRLEFRHSDVGTVLVEFLEVRPITASSPEAAPELYVPPALDTCPMDNTLPVLSTPFTIGGEVISDTDMIPSTALDSTAAARRLAQSYVTAREWEALDHINGTGDWPQWALDMYGGTHPAHRREMLAERRELASCGTKYPVSSPPIIFVCDGGVSTYEDGHVAVATSCKGNVGPFSILGAVNVDTCQGTIQGCVTVGIGLPEDNWLVKKTGIRTNIEIAKLCIGYNYKGRYFYLYGWIGLNLVIFKAGVSMELDMSSCCTWVNYIKLEAKVGLSFLNIWVTVGSVNILTNYYLKGDTRQQIAIQDPVAVNMWAEWKTVHNGWYGDWMGKSWPCAKFSSNGAGDTRLEAYPMNSYTLRVERNQGGGDDTALNGLSVGCMNGVAGAIAGGDGFWGDWYPPASCPPGGFFVGAKMRVEKDQGGGDDTAANSIIFTCSNQRGVDTVVHQGLWGDWYPYVYCPWNTYICGLEVRMVGNRGGGDDTALNGLRIACCTFPAVSNATVSSTTTITTATNGQGSCLDIINNNQVEGTYIQQYACMNENPAQLFVVTSTGMGTYTISSLNGLCLTVEGQSSASGTRLTLLECQGLLSQMFAIVPQSGERYSMTPAHANGMCVDVWGGGPYNFASIRIFTCHFLNSQLFSLDLPTDATTGAIYTSTAEGRCWDVAYNVQAPGTRIWQYTCAPATTSNAAQQFTVTAVGTNAYQIKSAGGYCLAIQGASTASGAPLVLEACSKNAPHQTFRASAGYQGGVALSPYHNPGMCVDVAGAGTSNGVTIWQYVCNGNRAQSFKLQLPV